MITKWWQQVLIYVKSSSYVCPQESPVPSFMLSLTYGTFFPTKLKLSVFKKTIFKETHIHCFFSKYYPFTLLCFHHRHRPALMPGVAELSHPIMSVRTHRQHPCSWELFLVAPCLACLQILPNICASPLMRFLRMFHCHPVGKWPRPPLGRDIFSSKDTNNNK